MNRTFTIIVLLLLFFELSNAQTPIKRVLLEEFSTAPCGFCPEGAIIAESLLKKYPELITFTHHAGFGVDSMTIDASKALAAKFTCFAPAGVIDRNYHNIPVYTYPDFLAISRQKWDSIISIHLNEPAEVEISINHHNFLSGTRSYQLGFSVKFLNDFPEDDYRYNVAIIEDSVTGIGNGWDQKNYFNDNPNFPTLYKKGDPFVGYIHRHVVRAMPYGAWGSSEGLLKVITKNYSKKITFDISDVPKNWKMENCSVIIFLSKYNTDIKQQKIYNTVQFGIPIDFLSVDEGKQNENADFSVFPNPVPDLGYINLEFENPTFTKLELYSSLGIKIREIATGTYQNSQNVYFYTSDLSAGGYFIKVETKNQTRFVSFIVE
jgi:hypothetical protein